ncbi:von Willebrand factor type A domain-containing protein [Micromonospora pattaloongensis]|uniref:von Willebrand factor type A domain-containing protein n=1 Tax=Micromonospora pattaloongensis TaxID=405436 RepID=A0A1H3FLX1_9ACTN|nr:VWA domain-containing protein [Micromonospora pattaloongensis]SDX91930.1 von Willebrand factor type A domain-containing protein [Micromonospora pattaloongensis]
MALVVVLVGGWFGYRQLAGPSCEGQLPLTVAAAPEIAPAVQAAATQWSADGGAVDGVCVAVQVAASDPVDVAAVVAGQHGIALAGVGQASGTAVAPDVWIPDSTTWLARLSLAASGFAPSNGGSVARSPVVVAMPEPVAGTLGWPNKQLGWKDLLTQVTQGTSLRTGIVEPSRDAAGLSGLLALSAAAQQAGNPEAVGKASTAALRALATGKSALREDLIARFPRSSDAAAVASALSAAPLSEEDVIEYNKAKPPIPLAALYLEPAPPSLDYPFAVMPGTDPAKAGAAQGLFEVLGTGAFRNRLGERGLRAPDGTWGAGFSAPPGAPSPAGTSAPAASPDAGGKAAGGLDPASVDRAISAWTAVTLPGRMLAVLDVSGSMETPVPTAGGATRMAVTLNAAQRGLALFDDSWAVGLWIFSTELDGSKPYRELAAIGPLTAQRSSLTANLASIKPKRNGSTGLYDSVLAAYKTTQEGWQAGRVNSIVVMTDGKNENPAGLTQARLLAELKRIKDPKRPIQVIMIGIGNEVNKAELESIVKATGGGAFVAEDPTKIGDIFLNAIARRPAPAK